MLGVINLYAEISYVHRATSVEIILKGSQPCGWLGNWRTQYLQWPGTYINWRYAYHI